MTIHTISSHALNGTEVWGPYTPPSGTKWIHARLGTPAHSDPTYRRAFLDNTELTIERSLDGVTWEYYGSQIIVGDTLQDANRDCLQPCSISASIKDDGYIYKVTVATTYEQEIYGEVEFEDTTPLPDFSTPGNIVNVVDYRIVIFRGMGGHGGGPIHSWKSPEIPARTDNSAIVVLNPEHAPLYLYPNGCDYFGEGDISTGDYKKLVFGSSDTEIPLVARSGSFCTVNAPIYVKQGLPNEKGKITATYLADDLGWYTEEGVEPELREPSYAAYSAAVILVVNNVDQINPVKATFAPKAINSGAEEPPYAGGSIGYTGAISSTPGGILFGGGIDAMPSYRTERECQAPSGSTSIFENMQFWGQPTFFPGGGDTWHSGASFRVAGAGSTTVVGEDIVFDPEVTDFATATASGVSIAPTKFVHMVVVETPADPGDRPSASQIRAGQDGFGSAAPYYTKRGPDADGTVRYDADSIDGFDEFTDCTFCFVYDNEGTPTYLEKTTAQGIYCVAVENPGTSALYPSAAQIKAGTDYYDEDALYAGAVTYPTVSGTEEFGAFTGAPLDTSLVLGFVTGDEDPIYEVVQTLALPSIDGDITISLVADGGFAYNQHPEIGGDITVTLTPASGIDYTRNASLAGDIDISINPAAGMAVARHYTESGAVEITFSPTADMQYREPGAIIGDITLSLSPAAALAYAQHKSLSGAVTISVSSAASLDYTESTQSIDGDVTIQIGVAGNMSHTLNAALTGTVTLTVTANSGMNFGNEVQESLAITGIFVRPSVGGFVSTRPSLSGQISLPH